MWSVMRSRRRLARNATWLIVVATTAVACGSSAEDGARETARTFELALVRAEAGKACSLLSDRAVSEVEKASGRPCADSILGEARGEAGGARDVSVFGRAAQVVFDGDTVFLSRFEEGWRVTAAACSPTAGGLYDCVISGG